MGKKSLTKSTTKKKTKTNTKKKGVAAPPESTGKQQAPAGKKKAAAPLTGAALLLKQFEVWTPKKPWKPKPDKAYDKNFSAPPFIDAKGKGAKKIKSLLLMPFDMKSAAASEPVKKPAEKKEKPESRKTAAKTGVAKKPREAAKKELKTEKKAPAASKAAPEKKASIKDLLALKFDPWVPEKPFAPETTGPHDTLFAAPPAFEGVDAALVLKQFDLSVPDVPKTPAPPEEKETVEPDLQTPGAAEPVAVDPKPVEPDQVEPEAVEPDVSEPAPDVQEVIETEAVASEPQAIETEKPSAPEPVVPSETPPVPKAEPKTAAPAEPPVADTTGGDGGGGDDDGGDSSGLPPQPPKEPLLGTGAKILVATLGIIFLILIAASISNSNRFFIKETREGVEILRGDFSPKSKTQIATLENARAPADKKAHYTKREVMALAYDHYMTNVRKLMEETGATPDLRRIRYNLENASRFALTFEQKAAVENRLKQVDFSMLIFWADIAADEQTPEGYKRALEYLKQAEALDIGTSARLDILDAKIRHIESRIESLEPVAEEES